MGEPTTVFHGVSCVALKSSATVGEKVLTSLVHILNVKSVKKEMRPIHLEVKNEDSAKDRIAAHEQPAFSAQPQSQRFSLGPHVKPTQPNGVKYYVKRIEPLRWLVELETSPHVPQSTFSVNR
ncbi:hypothetical protein YC2023_105366 [Brassica napus]